MRISVLWLSAASLAIAAPALAGPGDVDAHTFYTTATALKAKGMGAMLDRRLKPAMAQMKAAGTAVKAENTAATARGKPLYCVPAAAKKKGIGPDFIIAKLAAIPENRRRTITLIDAWREILVREYPCGA